MTLQEISSAAPANRWELRPAQGWGGNTRLFAAYGQGFMLPSSAAWSNGFIGQTRNHAVDSLTTDGVEFGLTRPLGDNLSVNFSLFRSGSGLRNTEAMRHDGLALAINGAWSNGIGTRLVYTSGRALSVKSACIASCLASDSMGLAGYGTAYGAGEPEQTLYGELSWRHPRLGFRAGLEARYVARRYTDEFSSDSTTAYFNANAHVGIEHKLGAWRIQEYARVDNLNSRGYGNADGVVPGRRPFDYAGERSYLIGIRAGYSW